MAKKNGKLAHLKDKYGGDVLRDAVVAGAAVVTMGAALTASIIHDRAEKAAVTPVAPTAVVETVNEK